ncbi:hypothetical protein E5676_scaffold299G001930 [Cucumis melo var. makuwa]|uniref:Uncharacterized protein n=1 Tax=Cucumis melo var. makuwa TaxID=1194695 RepID=A0A5A7TUU8_CUCMM|nr:hypothetical protein E6C27_scaffold243G004540 [Cucumis melo var. makuwa]TYK13674.1 hypothetical protein E5676_scaffold299G001930 [Cucumis melo var. makuwa]
MSMFEMRELKDVSIVRRMENIVDENYEQDDLSNTMNMVQSVHDQSSNTSNTFDTMFDDAKKPLYPRCKKFTKLSALVGLYNLKVSYGNQTKRTTAGFNIVIVAAVNVDQHCNGRMAPPHLENVRNHSSVQFLIVCTARNQPRASHASTHPVRMLLIDLTMPPSSSYATCSVFYMQINMLPPSFDRPPPFLQSNSYALPPIYLSYHLDVRNP